MRVRFIAPLVAVSLLAIAGCANGGDGSQGDNAAPTVTAEADPNVTACADVESLWRDVERWGTTEGNTDENGRPLMGERAPDYRIELDAIRQTTDGVLRTTLDEYYERTPTDGGWWFANGIHQYGYGNQVAAACESIGAPVTFPGE